MEEPPKLWIELCRINRNRSFHIIGKWNIGSGQNPCASIQSAPSQYPPRGILNVHRISSWNIKRLHDYFSSGISSEKPSIPLDRLLSARDVSDDLHHAGRAARRKKIETSVLIVPNLCRFKFISAAFYSSEHLERPSVRNRQYSAVYFHVFGPL